jgi:predicted site-specific integrase-resolvase
MNDKMYTLKEFAAAVGVTPVQANRWLAAGLIPMAVRENPFAQNGKWMIPHSAVDFVNKKRKEVASREFGAE